MNVAGNMRLFLSEIRSTRRSLNQLEFYFELMTVSSNFHKTLPKLFYFYILDRVGEKKKEGVGGWGLYRKVRKETNR